MDPADSSSSNHSDDADLSPSEDLSPGPTGGLTDVPDQYHRCRLAILGASSVGKSSLTSRFIYNEYNHSYIPTIEDEHHKVIEIDGEKYYVEVVDTAGQDQYTQMALHITLGMQGYILVFSVDDRDSFDIVQSVNEKLLNNLGAESNEIKRIVVGNKIDVGKEREVSTNEAQSYCRAQGINYMECSAMTGANVQQLFEQMLRLIQTFERPAKPKKQGGLCAIQ